MFIEQNDVIINLKKVSNIKFVNKGKQKVFFNYGYSVKLRNYGGDITISDYTEIPCDEVGFKRLKTTLSVNEYIQNNFIEYYNGYINIDEISSIKKDIDNLKIIINLSNPKSFNSGDDYSSGITSEFIFINCRDIKEFNYTMDNINSSLKDR